MKITFLGDIMCEPPVLKGAKRPGGKYDFSEVFTHVKPLLAEADYVVGNLETPLAGPEVKYTQQHYCFNAPDSYADAVKAAGIDMVATANNHTFDRGYDGLVRTIQVLDEKGIGHHGSSLPGQPRPEAYYAQVGDTKLAFICYTYGTNFGGSGKDCLAEGEYAGTVNLLKHQKANTYLPGALHDKDWVDKLFKKMYPEHRGRIKKLLGMCYTYPRADDVVDEEACAPYVAQIQADIRKAKEKADFVFFCPHMGGQFNAKPGYFTQYIAQKSIEAGVDAIVASHSHVPHIIKKLGNVPCAFSLGNFNMDPYSTLAMHENLSEYGLALHMYIEDKQIQKLTFSMIKNCGRRGGIISGYPVDKLYATLKTEKEKKALEADVAKLYGIVTGKPNPGNLIRKEYDLF